MIPADLLRLPLDSHAGRHEAHFSEAPSQSLIRLACCSRRPGGATAGRPAPDRCLLGSAAFRLGSCLFGALSSSTWSVSAGQWRVAVRAGHWLLCLFGLRRRRCTLVTARIEVADRYSGRLQLHRFAVHSVPVGNIGYPERNLCRRRASWYRSWSGNSLAPRG